MGKRIRRFVYWILRKLLAWADGCDCCGGQEEIYGEVQERDGSTGWALMYGMIRKVYGIVAVGLIFCSSVLYNRKREYSHNFWYF